MDIKKIVVGIFIAMAPISTAGMLSMYTGCSIEYRASFRKQRSCRRYQGFTKGCVLDQRTSSWKVCS